MSEALKERKEMDPQYQWDLTKMYASDAEWEKAFAAIDQNGSFGCLGGQAEQRCQHS